VLRGGDGTVRMEVVLRGHGRGAAEAGLPVDLVVVLDVSGSMAGEKLVHAKAALRALASWLRPQDRLAIVAYHALAWTALPLTHGTPQAAARRESVIEGLRARGGTHLSAGLDLGLSILRQRGTEERIARLVVVSDGLANIGDTTLEGLGGRARAARLGGATVSAVGVGLHFNEVVLTALADEGAGQFHYVQHPEGLEQRFGREFTSARANVARAIELHVRPAPGARLVDAAGYPIEARGDTLVIHPGPLHAGQERRFWLTFEVPTANDAPCDVGALELRYRHRGGLGRLAPPPAGRVHPTSNPAVFEDGLSPEAWARGVASQVYGQLLEDVASDLREREPDDAAARLERFRERYLDLAQRAGNPRLDATAERLRELEREVDAARRGDASPAEEAGRVKRFIDAGRLTRGR
jgi:Ca-activated chloride channel family protein